MNPHARKKNISLIAEGIETALSLASAYPTRDVKSVLDKSGFKHIDLQRVGRDVVLCLDNDLQHWQKDTLIAQAAKRLTDGGKHVWIAMPPAIDGKKTDFNDMLKAQGPSAIKDTLHAAVRYTELPFEISTHETSLQSKFEDA